MTINPELLKFARVARNLCLRSSFSFVPLSLEDTSQRMVSPACMRSLGLRVRLADMQGQLPFGCTAVWSGPKATPGKTGKKNISTDAHLIRLDFRWDDVLRTPEPGAMEIVAALRGVLLSGPTMAAPQDSQLLEDHGSPQVDQLNKVGDGDHGNDDDEDDEAWASAVKGARAGAALELAQGHPSEEDRGDKAGDEEDAVLMGESKEAVDGIMHRDWGNLPNDTGRVMDVIGPIDVCDGAPDAASPADASGAADRGSLVAPTSPIEGSPASPPLVIDCGAPAAGSSTGSSAGALPGRRVSGAAATAAATTASRVIGGRAMVSVAGSPAGSSSGGRTTIATAAPIAISGGISPVGRPVVGLGTAVSRPSPAAPVRGGAALSGAAGRSVPSGLAAALSGAGGSAAGGSASAAKSGGKKKAATTQPAPTKSKNKRAKLTEEMKSRQAAEAAEAAEHVAIVNTRTLSPATPFVVEQVAPNCIWPDGGVLVTVVFPFLTDHTWRLRGKLRVRLYMSCGDEDGAEEDMNEDAGEDEGEDDATAVPKLVENTYTVKAWLQPKAHKDIKDDDRIIVPQRTATRASSAISGGFLRATGHSTDGLCGELLYTRIIKTAPSSHWRFDTTFTTSLSLNSSAQCIDPTAAGFSVGWPVVADVDSMDVDVHF